jgi:hypothetical protein
MGGDSSQKLSLGGDAYSSPGHLLASILNINHIHGITYRKKPSFPSYAFGCLRPIEEVSGFDVGAR